jgi:nickel-dependent lactate racemase
MNKSFQLPYGKSHIDISIPEERVRGVLIPGESQINSGKSQALIVQQALENPIASKRLRELVVGKQNIVLIASDHTRPVPSKIITPLILYEIRLGNPHAHITILISTGTHRASTREELIDKFGQQIVDNERIVIHDSVKSEVVSIGTLPSGGEILINKLAVEADLLVSEGFIEPHFFAGFSGGRKSVFPGITNRQSVMANHCAEFIAHPKCSTGVLEGNPIHEDMLHAAEAAKLAFIVNVVLDERKNIMAAFAGHFIAAHLSGTNFIKSFAEVSRQPADIVISTNGGYPLDQNIYQSVKGMTTAESSCNPNGVIILLVECRDGHGGKSFFETFSNDKSLEEIEAEIITRNRDETVVDQWESQILVRVLLKHQVIMVTEASKEMINTFRMHYASTFEEAIEIADSILQKPDATITVIPNGMSVIVKQE